VIGHSPGLHPSTVPNSLMSSTAPEKLCTDGGTL